MPTPYRLTPTTPGDEAWLDALRRAAYRDLFDATWGGWDEERHRQHLAKSLGLGNIRAIEIDGARVGMLQVFEHADSVKISEIQVDPRHQGRGIGTQVILDVVARAHAQGKKVVLATGLTLPRALALYRRLGVVVVAETERAHQSDCRP